MVSEKNNSDEDAAGNSTEFLKQAYDLKTADQTRQFYSTWAQQYDDQMERGLRYVAPHLISQKLAQVVDDRSTAVLDVGCGTGLTAQHLFDCGFTVFDGLDFSDSMLEQARRRGIYRKLINADLLAPLDIADASYSAAISSGTFTVGHVGPEPIPQIFRVLKSGGFFAFSVHHTVWHEKGFDITMNDLEASHAIKLVSMEHGAFFEGAEQAAKYCVYQKL